MPGTSGWPTTAAVLPPVLPQGAAVTWAIPSCATATRPSVTRVSTDLISWTVLADARRPPACASAFDDLATWTGCVVRADDGTGRMSHDRAVRRSEVVERDRRLEVDRSVDLAARPAPGPRGRRAGTRPVTTAPKRPTGATLGLPRRSRDLHLYAHGTGRRNHPGGRGARGLRRSAGLDGGSRRSVHRASASRGPEVIRVRQLDGRWVMLFSCLAEHMPHDPPGAGGVWAVPVDGPGASVDLDLATRLTDEELYVGKLITLRDGSGRFLAFRNLDSAGQFVGGVTDPLPVGWLLGDDGIRLVDCLPESASRVT